MLVTAFHPELNDDPTVHRYFLEMVREAKAAAADEPYRRYLAALWISQYYFKTGNEERCREFFSKAAAVYPEGWLLKRAAARNAAGKTL